jgi:flavin reductase (DIM6/NTAB) family NADH-FMN oxidoreductase RutF
MEAAAVEKQAAPQEFGGTDFRNTVGAFATGVTVITTRGETGADDDVYGMTANAFSSVSLDPPLVLICVISGTQGAETIERNGVFAVNVLGAHQEPISRHFASRERPSGQAAFAGLPHRTAVTGSPILDRACAYLDCRVRDCHEAGDHLIFIGEVVAIGSDADVKPLVFHGGRYAGLEAAAD